MNPRKKYLLYVGNAYPHKNLERLLQAFKIVLKEKPRTKASLVRDKQDLSLVLVGKIDYFYEKAQKTAKMLNLGDKVVFTGRVSDKELSHLYQNALVYVFPSLAEGFGLPGLEAMKQGLPVVCSDKGPLPEIYDKAAVYFNAEDAMEMAQIILKVIFDHNLREEMTRQGYSQVKKYSWQKCAKETLEIYKSVVND